MENAQACVVLACDPASGDQYRYNLTTGDFAYESVLLYTEAKLQSELSQLKVLKGFEVCDWEFVSEACETYRRRKLRNALLQKSAKQFPTYTTSRELSPAFADKTDIKLIVDVKDYVPLDSQLISDVRRRDSDKLDDPTEFSSFHLKTSDQVLELRASLVTSAKEVLKNMLTDVYKTTRIKIQPKDPGNILTFKVSGKREYLAGNYPMLAYESVRAALREMEWLNVRLTEIPGEREEFFPPIVKVEGQGIGGSLPLLEDVPYALFWYPPEKLKATAPAPVQSSPTSQIYLPRLHQLLSSSPNRLSDDSTRNLLSGVSLQPPPLFTGQCDWHFRIRLCGCEKLGKIFEEGLWGSATNVGFVTPHFVVKPNAKKDKKEQHRSSSLSEIDSATKSKTVSRMTISSAKHSAVGLRSNFSNLAIGSGALASELAALFRLPFPLRQLRFEVMLTYGETVMRQCQVSSQAVAFTFSPRMMEWMTFGVRISELPKEARLCINIYGGGSNMPTEEISIGSASRSLFDEHGHIRTGLQVLNIWPFYTVEPRLACMGDFWGRVNSYYEGSSGIGGDDAVESGYGQIFVQFDEFLGEKNRWSLRDHEHMKSWYRRLSQPYHYQPATDSKNFSKRKMWSVWMFQGAKQSRSEDRLDEQDAILIQTKPTIDDLANLESVLAKDSLQELDATEKRLLFVCRDHYKTLPAALPMFLRSVDWTRPVQVTESHRMLKTWSKLTPSDGLLLLDAEFPDEEVRLYGIRLIAKMADDDLTLYMQQLVQALQFETQHLSYLSELLLERALRNPFEVGHELFWTLRAQLHFKPAAERFGLLLEQFLLLCGRYREELMAEVKYVTWLKSVGENVKLIEGKEKKQEYLSDTLTAGESTYNFPFTLSFDSRMQCQGVDPARCRVLSSKKLPLLVRLQNSELGCGELPIIFKVGDDMRQDMLTIQLIRVMDSIWLENGLDLRMKTYRVTATHDMVGMIEFVMRSQTTKEIQANYGGTLGSFKKEPLKEFLTKYNTDEESFKRSVDNFIRSCAGYCVATYILGIGDRHNDNIMMAETGHLFHIDFGHFLGNFKSKMGIKRERTPFVFTEEMAFVMEGKDSVYFSTFEDYCCQAYNLIRKFGRRFINLFKLMISAGMPELMKKDDIVYLRNMLSLQMTEMEAGTKFRAEIQKTLNDTFRKFDNWIHQMKHG